LNRPVRTPRFELSRRGGFQLDTEIMQSTWTRQSRVHGRFENGFPLAQQKFGPLERQTLEKILGGHSSPRREKAMEMKRAQARVPRQALQGWLVGLVLIQVSNHARDALVMIHRPSLPSSGTLSHPILAAKIRDT